MSYPGSRIQRQESVEMGNLTFSVLYHNKLGSRGTSGEFPASGLWPRDPYTRPTSLLFPMRTQHFQNQTQRRFIT